LSRTVRVGTIAPYEGVLRARHDAQGIMRLASGAPHCSHPEVLIWSVFMSLLMARLRASDSLAAAGARPPQVMLAAAGAYCATT
jgi:hypothetical protein